MEDNLQILTDLNQTLANMMAAHEARVDSHTGRLDDHANQMAEIQASTHRTEEMHQTLLTMLASHDERLDDHAGQMASIRETNLILAEVSRDLAAMLVLGDQQLASLREMVEEARQDHRMTRNLWVRLARRNGWLEDDNFQV